MARLSVLDRALASGRVSAATVAGPVSLVDAALAAASSVLSEGIVAQQEDGTIISCNPAAERILGLTADQMMGRTSVDPRWRAIREDGSPFPGEEHPAMVTLRTGRPLEGVIMGVHTPEGSLRWISINSTPFEPVPPGGEGKAVVTSFTDITARRDAEASLRAEEERFHAAIGAMRDAVAILSPVRDSTGEIVDFRYDYANEAHCELVALDRARLVGRRLDEAHPGWVQSERFDRYRQVALTGEPFRTEDFQADPAWGMVFARRKVDVFVARASQQLVVSARDVTKRRQIEAQLRASEERFDAAVESMLDAFLIVSPVRDDSGEIVDFRYEYANRAYCVATQLELDQLLGHGIGELFPAFLDERLALYRQVQITGEEIISQLLDHKGAWTATILADRVHDAMITPMGENLVVSYRDVTARWNAQAAAEIELRASRERLAKAERIAGTGSWEQDLINDRVTFSDGMLTIYGIGADQFDGTFAAARGFVYPADRERVEATIDQAIAERASYVLDYRAIRADGRVRDLRSHGGIVVDDNGTPVRVVGIVQDITDAKLTQKALQSTSAELGRRASELQQLALRSANEPPEVPYTPLSARQLEIMQMVAQGLTNAAIGQRLHVTEGTVKWHVRQVLAKTNSRNRAEALARVLGGAL